MIVEVFAVVYTDSAVDLLEIDLDIADIDLEIEEDTGY